ncbi:glutamate racemase [Candidatus Nomurabacteria bacterium]|nr:glutamate racemase [Candidatus Nomurabacteria bacterium]
MSGDTKFSNKNKAPIGVFDSGVGGLSVLVELKKILPHENFVFLADQKYVPYGEKTKKELIELGYRVTNYLIKKHKIKMMVVACNTSTVNSVNELRARYSLPIVGTVPAVKPAAEQTKTGTLAIISTPATAKSAILKELIENHCKGVKVLVIGCKNLEDTVEKGDLKSAKTNNLLKKYLKQVVNSDADCLVLGCTHYPFLKNPIQKIVGEKVKLIDGNIGIAKQTANLLIKNSLKNIQRKSGEIQYFTTKDAPKFEKVAGSLLKTKIVAFSAHL